MAEHAKFYVGQLRWANHKVGLEFSPLDSDVGGDARRLPRHAAHGRSTGAEAGLLLQDDLERDGYGEGCGVIVIALPRRMYDHEIREVRDRLASTIRTEAYDDIAELGRLLAYKRMSDGD